MRTESASTIHSAIDVTHASSQNRMLGRNPIAAELPRGARLSNHPR
jgi:hypothetical protein